MNNNQRRAKAFTLIELAAVITIIAILLSIVGKAVVTIKTSRLANARFLTNASKITEINSLVAWYETSYIQSFKADETQDQDWLSIWNDITPSSLASSPNKNALSRTASANVVFEESGINKLPSVKFDGSVGANFTLGQIDPAGSFDQATIFIVFRKLSNSTSIQNLLDSNSAGNDFSLGVGNDEVNFNAGTSVTTSTATNPASFAFNENVILVAYFNGSFSRAFSNDATEIVGGSDLNIGLNNITGLTIGTDKNGASGFSGLVSEIIIFKEPLPKYLRKDILNYLSNKYDIRVGNL